MTINLLCPTAIVLIILAAKCGTVESQTPTEAGASGASESTPSYPETEYTPPVTEVYYTLVNFVKQIQETSTTNNLILNLHSVAYSESNGNLAGSKSTILKCSRKPATDYKKEYLPVMYKRNSAKYGRNAEIHEEIKHLENYFIFLTKEVWLCKDESEPKNEPVTRIVNAMIGKPGINISHVYYADGVNVISRKMGDFKTVLIREIKYFIPGKKGPNNVPYVGKCVFPLAELVGDGVNLLAYREMRREPDAEGKFKEINFNLDMDKVNRPIAEKIYKKELVSTLRLGSESDGVIGDSTSLATCFREQAVYAFPHEFRTEIFQDVEFGKSKAKVSAKVTEKDYYYKYVLPIEEEVWNCKLGDDKIFLRIVNRGHIMREAKYICKESIVFLSNYKLPNGEQRPLFREIKYIDPKNGAVVRYDGSLKFMVKKELADRGFRDFEYRLNWNRVYRSLFGASGFDIRIGSRYVKTIGTVNDVVKCDLLEADDLQLRKALNTELRLKTNVKGKSHSLRRIFPTVAGSYFLSTNRVIFNCSSETGDIKFLRVKNEIELGIPVRELELFDGVFVLGGGEKEERILEIKYVDPEDFTAVKYEGQIKLIYYTGFRSTELLQNVKFTPTCNEVDLLVGHLTVKDSTWKGITYSSSGNRVFRIGEDSSNTPDKIKYCTDASQVVVGNSEDIAECDPFSSEDQPDNSATGSPNINNYERLIKINEVNSPFDAYFKPEKRITWNCTIPSTGIEFYKVLYRDSLRQEKVISKTEISYCSGGSVWFELKNDEPQCYMQGIMYLQKKENYLVEIKYEGKIAMRNEEKTEERANWRSGTADAGKQSENREWNFDYRTREIDYKLDDRELLLTSLNNKHTEYTLIIDRKWEYEIGDENSLVTCSNNIPIPTDSEELIEAFLSTRVKILSIRDKPSHTSHAFTFYFEMLKRDIWICEDWNTNEDPFRFYRIVIHNVFKKEFFGYIEDILHSSGVTVLLGDAIDDHELAELIYVDKNMIPIKFGGKVRLLDTNVNPGSLLRIAGLFHENVMALEFSNEVTKELNYLLRPGEMFRTDVAGDRGDILEIGRPYTKRIGGCRTRYICRGKYFTYEKDTERSDRWKTQGDSFSIPLVVSYNGRDGKTKFSPMNKENLKEMFYFMQQTWYCEFEKEAPSKFDRDTNAEDEKDKTDETKTIIKSFWRIERKLLLKTPRLLSRIYHYDGVTIEHNINGHVIIRELSYFLPNYETETYEVVRFDGFLHFEKTTITSWSSWSLWNFEKENEAMEKKEEEVKKKKKKKKEEKKKEEEEEEEAIKFWRMDRGREFLYIEDTPRINVFRDKKPGNGLILELVRGKTKNDLIGPLVICTRLEEENDRAYVEELGIQFASSENADGTERDRIDFSTLKQDVYDCHDKKNHFRKIENIVLIKTPISAVYFGVGITVDKVKLPDGNEVTLLKEIKYMTKDTNELLKYEGEVTTFKTFSSNLASLFQMPISFESFPMKVNDENAKKDELTRKSAWPLEVLRIFALQYEGKSVEKVHIKYTDGTKREVIDSDSQARLHFESRWEKEMTNEDNDEMRCILDQWNPTTHLKFITRVTLIIDDHQYFFDDETIGEYFNIDKIEVWICVNKQDTIIRVVTKLEGVKEIYGISYIDGVEVKHITLPSGRKSVNVTETLYIDAKAFKFVQYKPELNLLEPIGGIPSPPQPLAIKQELRQLGGDMEKNVVKGWNIYKGLIERP